MYNTANQSINETISSTEDHSPIVVVIIIQVLLFATVIFIAFTGNILVCIAVYKFRRLQTTTNYALVSLAATDILMVYVMILHAIMNIEGEWTMGKPLCEISSSVGLTLNLMSLLHLAYISLDRFIAIIKPFRYQVWITNQRVVISMLSLWFCAVLLLNGPWGDFEYRANVFGCLRDVKRGHFKLSTFLLLIMFVSIPSAFILFTQIWVCNIARGHAKKINKQQKSFRVSTCETTHPVITSGSGATQSPKVNSETAFRREMKSVKTFGILVGCFVVCYIPFYTVATLRSFKGQDSVHEHVLRTVTWLALANSAMNPILYSLRHRQFKTAFEKIFRKGLARIVPMQMADTSLRRNSALGQSSTFSQAGDTSQLRENSLVTVG